MGTLNLIESLKLITRKCYAVIITSDKCYFNVEKKNGYKETDTLGGTDPYSASKASAEHVIKSQVCSYFKYSNKVRIYGNDIIISTEDGLYIYTLNN